MQKKRSYYRPRKLRNSLYRWTNHDLRKTQILQSLHPPPVSAPIGAAKRGFRHGCTLLVDRLCHFQNDLGFHYHGDFFGSPLFFFSSSWLNTTHSVKSAVFGATVGWHCAN